MDTKKTPLLVLLLFNLVSTAFHYADNYLDFDKYPAPTWMTLADVYQAWIVLTLFGIAGYLFYIKNNLWLAYFCLIIYSMTSISSPAHYFYPTHETFSLKMHLLIWSDAIAGISLLIFILRSASIVKEWHEKKIVQE